MAVCFRGLEVKYDIWEVKHHDGNWERYTPKKAEAVDKPASAISSHLQSRQVDDESSQSSEAQDGGNVATQKDFYTSFERCDEAQKGGTQDEQCDCEEGSNHKEFVTAQMQGRPNSSQLSSHIVDIIGNNNKHFSNHTGKQQQSPGDDTDASISSDVEDNIELDGNDPALYACQRLNEPTIRLLINKPYQPAEGFVFSTTNGRSCTCAYFYRTLPDNTTQVRKWLSYSRSAERVYCLHCMLFGGPAAIESLAWVKHGCNNWS